MLIQNGGLILHTCMSLQCHFPSKWMSVSGVSLCTISVRVDSFPKLDRNFPLRAALICICKSGFGDWIVEALSLKFLYL